MRESVFILSCIQYCSYMKLMSFCKMTPISYDYITEYITVLSLHLNCESNVDDNNNANMRVTNNNQQ